MASASAELQEKMRRFSNLAGASGVKLVKRMESPARSTDVYRSGWGHSPEVQPPMSFIPSKGSERSSSCPQRRAPAASRPVRQRASSPRQLAARQNSTVSMDSETPSARSQHSLQSASTAAAVTTGPGLHHEGWLSKRTSGKVSRWQRRYFTLDGCTLQYTSKPGTPARRRFDIRRARRIGVSERQARELELDFGFRVWRLAADSPEVAHRWLLMLDAARLLAGPALDGTNIAEDWSDDDDNVSVASSATSGTSSTTSALFRMAASPARPEPFRLETPVPTVAECVQLDVRDLESRLVAWLPAGPLDGAAAARGLDEALAALWGSLGAKAAARGPHARALEAALKSLAGPAAREPEALGRAVEGVLAEYLSRLLRRLERWVADTEPAAGEVAHVLRWFLFQAQPALERFAEGASRLAGSPMQAWRALSVEMERLLTSEWETRACSDVASRCEALRQRDFGPARAFEAVQTVRDALEQLDAWQGSPSASERAASLPIAALNASLRAFQSCLKHVLEAPAPPEPPAARRSRSLSNIGSMIREVSRGAQKRLSAKKGEALSVVAPAPVLAAAASEAGGLADFCTEAAKAHHGPNVVGEVLEAFAAAWEREAAKLCTQLVEAHFVTEQKALLKAVRVQPDTKTEEAPFGRLCAAAEDFVRTSFPMGPHICEALAGASLCQVLTRQWVKQFRVAPPKLSSCQKLPSTIEADGKAIAGLAERCGATAICESFVANPLRPYEEVASIIQAPSPELAAMCTARLEVLLGAEKGKALGNAARLAALR